MRQLLFFLLMCCSLTAFTQDYLNYWNVTDTEMANVIELQVNNESQEAIYIIEVSFDNVKFYEYFMFVPTKNDLVKNVSFIHEKALKTSYYRVVSFSNEGERIIISKSKICINETLPLKFKKPRKLTRIGERNKNESYGGKEKLA